MVGMRDRLIHGYFGIDYELVWDAIKVEIPRIKPELEMTSERIGGVKNE